MWSQDSAGAAGAPGPALTVAPLPQASPAQKGAGDHRWGRRLGALVTGVIAVAGLMIALLSWLNPDPTSDLSTAAERGPYIEQVDALCQETMSSNGQIEEPTDAEAYARAADLQAGSFGRLLETWAEIPPPRETDWSKIMPILDELEVVVDSMREVADWVRLGDLDQAGKKFDRMAERATEFRQLSREYGFRVCPDLGRFRS